MDSVEQLLSTSSMANEFLMASSTPLLTVIFAITFVSVNAEASQLELEVVYLFVQPSFSSVDNVGIFDSYRCTMGGDFIFNALEVGY